MNKVISPFETGTPCTKRERQRKGGWTENGKETDTKERKTSQGDIWCQVSVTVASVSVSIQYLCMCVYMCVRLRITGAWISFHSIFTSYFKFMCILYLKNNKCHYTVVSDEMYKLCPALSWVYNDGVSTESVSYLPVLRFIDSPRSETAVLRGPSVTLYIAHTHTHTQRHTPGHSESYPKGNFVEDSCEGRRPRKTTGRAKCYRETNSATVWWLLRATWGLLIRVDWRRYIRFFFFLSITEPLSP